MISFNFKCILSKWLDISDVHSQNKNVILLIATTTKWKRDGWVHIISVGMFRIVSLDSLTCFRNKYSACSKMPRKSLEGLNKSTSCADKN